MIVCCCNFRTDKELFNQKRKFGSLLNRIESALYNEGVGVLEVLKYIRSSNHGNAAQSCRDVETMDELFYTLLLYNFISAEKVSLLELIVQKYAQDCQPLLDSYIMEYCLFQPSNTCVKRTAQEKHDKKQNHHSKQSCQHIKE